MAVPRILIVDDTAGTAAMFCRMLRESGDCVAAASGAAALEAYWQAVVDDRPFDLVLLDLAMPNLSGFEVAEAIRQEDNDTHLVFLTAYHDPEIAARAWSIGVEAIWNKPVVGGELVEKVEGLLRMRDEGTRRWALGAGH